MSSFGKAFSVVSALLSPAAVLVLDNGERVSIRRPSWDKARGVRGGVDFLRGRSATSEVSSCVSCKISDDGGLAELGDGCLGLCGREEWVDDVGLEICAAETLLLVTLETGKDWCRRSFTADALLGSTKFLRACVMEARPPSSIDEPFSAASPSRCTTEAADETGVGGI